LILCQPVEYGEFVAGGEGGLGAAVSPTRLAGRARGQSSLFVRRAGRISLTGSQRRHPGSRLDDAAERRLLV
jgi:hypothetical protein